MPRRNALIGKSIAFTKKSKSAKMIKRSPPKSISYQKTTLQQLKLAIYHLRIEIARGEAALHIQLAAKPPLGSGSMLIPKHKEV